MSARIGARSCSLLGPAARVRSPTTSGARSIWRSIAASTCPIMLRHLRPRWSIRLATDASASSSALQDRSANAVAILVMVAPERSLPLAECSARMALASSRLNAHAVSKSRSARVEIASGMAKIATILFLLSSAAFIDEHQDHRPLPLKTKNDRLNTILSGVAPPYTLEGKHATRRRRGSWRSLQVQGYPSRAAQRLGDTAPAQGVLGRPVDWMHGGQEMVLR